MGTARERKRERETNGKKRLVSRFVVDTRCFCSHVLRIWQAGPGRQGARQGASERERESEREGYVMRILSGDGRNKITHFAEEAASLRQ